MLIISAPGEAREVAEIAREVLHGPPPDSAGLPAGHVAGLPAGGVAAARRIGILLRSPGPYIELLHEAFASAQVGAHFARDAAPPLSRTPAGRALENLAGLAGGLLRRAEVMDFLTGAPLKPVDSLFDAPPVAEWNAITIAAGIVAGRREWESRLDNFARGGRPEGTAALAAAVPVFRQFLKRLFDGLETVAAQPTWLARMAALTGLYRALIVIDEPAEAALGALDTLSGLDALGEPPTPERFRARVRDLLADARPAIGAFERNEPAVVSLMAARGVPFDLVIVPGLVEKSFPQPAQQDPILLDAERERLAAQLARAGKPADVPLKARRREEEELLFALAVQSARQRLVLTFPRLDAATARERVPSHFLLRMLETLSGQTPDYRELDQFIRRRGRFVRTTRFDPEARDRAVTDLEYDLATFGKAERDRQPDALLYFSNDERRFFARAMEAESARWGKAAFSGYDGVVQSPGLARALGKRLYDESRPVSPTRLEDYAQCPFSYLLRHVFGLEPTDEPERATTLSPQDRGSLVHEVLWQFLSEAARDGALPLTEAHWPRLQAAASARFAAFERRGVTGYPMLWRIEQARLLEDLREFLEREITGRSSFSPAHFEVRFGMPARGDQESGASTRKPALLELAPGAPIRFCGKIDRVDVDPAAQPMPHPRLQDRRELSAAPGRFVPRRTRAATADLPHRRAARVPGPRPGIRRVLLRQPARRLAESPVHDRGLAGKSRDAPAHRADDPRRHPRRPVLPGAGRGRLRPLRVPPRVRPRPFPGFQDGGRRADHGGVQGDGGNPMTDQPAATRRLADQAERDRATNDLDTTFLVEAAAGTGKTTILVDRILSILRAGRASLREIAAITFTEKAAGELKVRLRQAVERELRQRPTQADTARPQALSDALADLEGMPVNTIHAFCADLIRERPVEAGVEPGFARRGRTAARR